jgi:hypothetical protein
MSVVEIDLNILKEMHPRLPAEVVLSIVGRAALALERNGHKSGLSVSWHVQRSIIAGQLTWPAADLGAIDKHDQNRVTEDGAEAVALAVAHRHAAWRVVRRMQREEHADWLLEDGDQRLIALEVSGVDKGSIDARMSEKLKQVAASEDVDERWAGVVGFEAPTAGLRPAKGRPK